MARNLSWITPRSSNCMPGLCLNLTEISYKDKSLPPTRSPPPFHPPSPPHLVESGNPQILHRDYEKALNRSIVILHTVYEG